MGGSGYRTPASDSMTSRHSSALSPSRAKMCYCGVPAALRTSYTPRNPGRQFFGCQKFRTTEDCHFFEYFDEPYCLTCIKHEKFEKLLAVSRMITVITFGIIMTAFIMYK